jgi:hypothetical protein
MNQWAAAGAAAAGQQQQQQAGTSPPTPVRARRYLKPVSDISERITWKSDILKQLEIFKSKLYIHKFIGISLNVQKDIYIAF